MEGPTSSGGSRNRITCLTLQEHDDDDDDDDTLDEGLYIFMIIPKHTFGGSIKVFSENCAVCEIMWKNMIQPDRP